MGQSGMGELAAEYAEKSSSPDDFGRDGGHREGGGFVSSKTLDENENRHVDEDEKPGYEGGASLATILIAYG
jgi:hypothetical protein